MGLKESSLRGHHQNMVRRPTDYPAFPTKSGSASIFPARAPDYSNIPFPPPKGAVRTNSNSNTSTAPQGKSSGVMTFHSSQQWKLHFEAAKNTDKLVVIDFTATWCGPCRAMDAVINEFAAKYTYVEFIKIDIDELHDVAMKYQVVTVPTFLLMKKGQVVGKVVGANKDQLKAKIELFLY